MQIRHKMHANSKSRSFVPGGILLCCAMLFLFLSFGAAGVKAAGETVPGNEPGQDHIHKDVLDVEKSTATCTTGGTVVYVCTECGREDTYTIRNGYGHDPVEDPAVRPTFTSAGKTSGSHCSRCGHIWNAQFTIPKLDLGGTCKVKSVTATSKGIEIKWNKLPKANGYLMFKKTGNGDWKAEYYTYDGRQTSYLDKDVEYGTTYAYKVGGFVIDDSDWGYYYYAPAIVEPVKAFKQIYYLEPVKWKQAVSTGKPGQALLQWTKNRRASGYLIEVKKGNKTVKTITIKKNRITETTLSGLAKGKYSICIRAYRKSGSKKYMSSYSKKTVSVK